MSFKFDEMVVIPLTEYSHPNSDFIDFPNHRYEEMKFDWEEIITPRNDEQRDVIDFMCGRGGHAENLGASQLFVVKAPGFG